MMMALGVFSLIFSSTESFAQTVTAAWGDHNTTTQMKTYTINGSVNHDIQLTEFIKRGIKLDFGKTWGETNSKMVEVGGSASFNLPANTVVTAKVKSRPVMEKGVRGYLKYDSTGYTGGVLDETVWFAYTEYTIDCEEKKN